MQHIWIFLFWLILLVLSWPYVKKNRHPKARPVAAYLVFVSILTLISGTVHFLGFWLLAIVLTSSHVTSAVAGALLFIMTMVGLVIAFLTARHVIRRRPYNYKEPPP